MKKSVTIIYANRNRDLSRIKASFLSLKKQENQNFNVVFVDYGSSDALKIGLQDLIKAFDFVKYISLETAPLLWNKSKALNYGIKETVTPFIFIADVDLIFHPLATDLFEKTANTKEFNLFTMAYLDAKESKTLAEDFQFEKVQVRNYGNINGMVLASKKAFEEVHGYDEFFHFYGAEDEDLCGRMKNAGYSGKSNTETFFYHNWHLTYPASEDNKLSRNPRVENIRRINQYHFSENKKNRITKPKRQKGFGNIVSKEDLEALKHPTKTYFIPNILAFVEHLIYEELASVQKGEVVKVEFYEDAYFLSLKYKVKKILGNQTQPYITMKEVNDIILKKIVFDYRNSIYSFEISEDLKKIIFCIKI